MKIIVLISSLIFLSSCGTFSSKTTVYYATTSCSDPWRNYEQSTEKGRVKRYLKENDVRVYKVTKNYDDELAQTCEACTCTGGNILEIRIAEEDKDIALSIGFSE